MTGPREVATKPKDNFIIICITEIHEPDVRHVSVCVCMIIDMKYLLFSVLVINCPVLIMRPSAD